MGQFSKAFLQLLAWNSYLTKRIEKILVYEKKDRDLLKNFAVRNFSFDLVFNFFSGQNIFVVALAVKPS